MWNLVPLPQIFEGTEITEDANSLSVCIDLKHSPKHGYLGSVDLIVVFLWEDVN